MAAKVALTAEEFRENSQRSIALFNTEKLSTDSTHVLKSAYCNSVHFCRCNLHGACGGKVSQPSSLLVDKCCNLHGACGGKALASRHHRQHRRCNLHGACGGKVLAPLNGVLDDGCNLHGACGGKVPPRLSSALPVARCNLHGACGGKDGYANGQGSPTVLQSARGVWRQRSICSCGCRFALLQSARGVWRQRSKTCPSACPVPVAICTGRVEAKRLIFCNLSYQ